MRFRLVGSILATAAALYGANLELDALLGQLQQAEDLSKKTIRESAGYVITYTRQDLDRMHIKSLKEILERLPFLRYNEDHNGLTDLLYVPFQPTQYGQIKLYIDDKEASDALFGNSLQVFSEMDLSYIDHIEIYLGAVSFTLGTEPSLTIIKLYTKDPARENSDTLDMSGGSYGKKDMTYLSAKELERGKYLAYFNHRDLRRKKIHYKSTVLSRDKKFDQGYFIYYKDHLRYELFACRLDIHPFTAGALDLQPSYALTSTRNFFTGLHYFNPDSGWKSYLYFTYSNIWGMNEDKGVLGVLPQKSFPFLRPYKSHRLKATSTVLESELSKKMQLGKKWSMLLGAIGKVKSFEFLINRFDELDLSHSPYNQEKLFTAYMESSYLFNDKNIAILSLKKDKYYENGPVKDYDQSMVRLGYIYNSHHFVSKIFAIHSDFKPSPMELLEAMSSGGLDKQKYRVYALELQRNRAKSKLSMLYTYMKIQKLIARDIKRMRLTNLSNDLEFNSLDLRYRYQFDLYNKIEVDGFVVHPNYHNAKSIRKLYGGHIVLFNRYKDFDFYNALVYRKWTKTQGSGIDYSFTIDYKYSDDLRFYLKGINVFDSAITNDYYGYDLAKSKILELPDVSVIDRQFLVGMEWQF